MFSRIIVTGSLAFDHIMALPGKFGDFIMPDKIHRLNVSFTVEDFRREDGGTGGNLAYTLALLQKPQLLLAMFGCDGEEYRKKLVSLGVDCAHAPLHDTLASAQGFVMTDRDDNQMWSFYPGATKDAHTLSLASVVHAGDFVALLPSSPQAFETHVREAVALKTDFLFDPAFLIPVLSIDVLTLGLNTARVIIGNDYEIALLEQRTKTTVEDWLHNEVTVITTLGPKGSVIQYGTERWEIPVAPAREVVDPTGAGDAYRGGFLAGFMDNKPLPECGRMGAVAAVYAVQEMGTQRHEYTLEAFNERLAAIR